MPALVEKVFERPEEQASRSAQARDWLTRSSPFWRLIALMLQTAMLMVSLFEQPLPYDDRRIRAPSRSIRRNSCGSCWQLTGGDWSEHNRVDVLTNGDAFYPAELDAISHAKHFIHIECYIFQKGRVTDQILHALEERAAAGVEVRLVIDSVGSTAFPKKRFETLERAGGRIGWYHPLRWYTLPRANNRTHREIVVVDGTVGFAAARASRTSGGTGR